MNLCRRCRNWVIFNVKSGDGFCRKTFYGMERDECEQYEERRDEHGTVEGI